MRFEVLQHRNEKDRKVQWYWQATSSDGTILMGSGRGFDDVKTCYADLRRVKVASAFTVENLVTGESVLLLGE